MQPFSLQILGFLFVSWEGSLYLKIDWPRDRVLLLPVDPALHVELCEDIYARAEAHELRTAGEHCLVQSSGSHATTKQGAHGLIVVGGPIDTDVSTWLNRLIGINGIDAVLKAFDGRLLTGEPWEARTMSLP